MRLSGFDVIADGKIVEEVEIVDALGMLQQVGAAPAPAESAAVT